MCQRKPLGQMDCLPDLAEMDMFKGVYGSRSSTIWMCSVVKAMAMMLTEAIMWLIGIKATIHKKHFNVFPKV